MKIIYPAIFHKEGNQFWVEFPDLEGCHTYGENLEETLFYAKEALELHAATLLESGEKLNAPTDISSLDTDSNSFATLVYGDIDNYLSSGKAIKKTLTIPEWVNKLGIENNINFSQTLTDAILHQYMRETR